MGSSSDPFGSESNDSSPIIGKDQLDNFKEIIKSNVLENIVNGLQQCLEEREKPKHLYDKQLGFGEAPANKVLQQEGPQKGVMGKATDLILLNKQGAAA